MGTESGPIEVQSKEEQRHIGKREEAVEDAKEEWRKSKCEDLQSKRKSFSS
jgi:hypothetical protein